MWFNERIKGTKEHNFNIGRKNEVDGETNRKARVDWGESSAFTNINFGNAVRNGFGWHEHEHEKAELIRRERQVHKKTGIKNGGHRRRNTEN